MASLGELIVTLTLSNKKFSRNLEEAQKGTLDFNTALTRVSQTMASVFTQAMAAASASVVAFGVAAVKTGKDFEYAMTEVAAISGATADEMGRLEERSRLLGATTMFTATEAAKGMGELARTGLKTTSILRATGDALNFAGANSSSVSQSAKMLASTMAQFNIAAHESGRITDVFTTSVQNSLMDVNALQSSMKYGGSIAGAFGHSLEDTTAALSLFRDLGLEGSTAGVRFRQAMLSLAKPTEGAEKVLKKYGLTVDDVNPKLHSFAEIMTTLGKKQIELGDMVTLVSKRAAGDVTKIATEFAQGTSKFDSLVKKMNDSAGLTEETYKKFVNTVQGKSLILKSALQETYISLFDPAKPQIKGFLTFVTDVIRDVGEYLNTVPTMVQNAFGLAFGDVSKATDELKNKFVAAILEMIFAITDIIATIRSWMPTLKILANILMTSFPYIAIVKISQMLVSLGALIMGPFLTSLAALKAGFSSVVLGGGGVIGMLGRMKNAILALSVAARMNLVGALVAVTGSIAYYISQANSATQATYSWEIAVKSAQRAQASWDAYLKGFSQRMHKTTVMQVNALKLQLAQRGKLTASLEGELERLKTLSDEQKQELLASGRLIELDVGRQRTLADLGATRSKIASEFQDLVTQEFEYHKLLNKEYELREKLEKAQQKAGSKTSGTAYEESVKLATQLRALNKEQTANYDEISRLEKQYKLTGREANKYAETATGGTKVLIKDVVEAIAKQEYYNASINDSSIQVKEYSKELLPLHTVMALAKADHESYGDLLFQVQKQLDKNGRAMKSYSKSMGNIEKNVGNLDAAQRAMNEGYEDTAKERMRAITDDKREISAAGMRIDAFKQIHKELIFANRHRKDFNKLSEESQKILSYGTYLSNEQAESIYEEIEALKKADKSVELYGVSLNDLSKGYIAIKDTSMNLKYIENNMNAITEGHASLSKEFTLSTKMLQGMQDEWDITVDTYKTNQKIMQLQQKKTTKATKRLTGKLEDQTRALERLIKNFERTKIALANLDRQIESASLSDYMKDIHKLGELHRAATDEAAKYLQKAIDMRKEGKLRKKDLEAAEQKSLAQRIQADATAMNNRILYARIANKTILDEMRGLNDDILNEYGEIGKGEVASLRKQNKAAQSELRERLDGYKQFFEHLKTEETRYITSYYENLAVQAKREIKNKDKLKKRLDEISKEKIETEQKNAKEIIAQDKKFTTYRETLEDQRAVLSKKIIAQHHKEQLDELKAHYKELEKEQLQFNSQRLLETQKTEIELAKKEEQTAEYIEQLKQNHLLQLKNLQSRHIQNTIREYGKYTQRIVALEKASLNSRIEPLSKYYSRQAEFFKSHYQMVAEHQKIIADLEAKTADGKSGVTQEDIDEAKSLLKQLESIFQQTYEKEMRDSFASFLEYSSKGMAKYMQIFGQSMKGKGVVEPLVYGLAVGYVETEKVLGKIKHQFNLFYDEILNNKELSKSEKSLAMLAKPFKELGKAVSDGGKRTKAALQKNVSEPAKQAYKELKNLYEQKGAKGVALEGLKALGTQAQELAVNTGEFFSDMGLKLQEALKNVDFKVLAIKARAIAKEIYKYSSMIIKSIGSIVSSMANSLISVGSKVSSYLTGGMSLNPLEILADGVSEITDILEDEAADTSAAEDAITDARKKFAEGRISAAEMAEAEKEYEYQKSQAGEGEDPKTAQEQASEFVDNLIEKVLATINMIVEVGPTIITKFIQALPKVFNAIAAALPKLITVIMQEGPKLLITIIQGFIDAIPGLVTAIVQQLPVLVSQLVTLISEKMPELIQVLTLGLVQLINHLVEAIPEILDAIFQPAEDGGKSLFETLIDGLTQGLIAVIQALPTIITAILKQLPTIIKTLLASIGDIIQALIDALPDIIDALILALPDIMDALLEGFLILLEKILEMLPDLIEYLVSMLPRLLRTILQMIPRIITKLVEALPGIITSLVKLLPVLITSMVTLLPSLIIEIVKALPEIIIALVNGIVEMFTNPEIMGQIIYALTIGLIGAFIEAGWELIKMLGKFFADVITEIVTLGVAETETFGDTPQPIKAGSDGLLARFAPNDYVIAAQRPKDVLNQAMSLLGNNMGSAVNKIAAPKPLIQSPGSSPNVGGGQLIDIAVVAEGKLLSNIQVDAMDKGKAPKLKKKFQRASGATVGFNRGRYNKFGT